MNLGDLATRASRFHGERTAVVDGERTLSFEDVDARANRLANGLLELGVAPGDRFAALVGNRLEWFDATFGPAKAGIVRTYVNPRSSAAEVARQLADARVSAILLHDEYRPLLAEADLDGIRTIEIGPAYEQWLAACSPAPPAVAIAPDDVLGIQYSSGTSGPPKGVLFTHRMLVSSTRAFLEELDMGQDDVHLHVGQLSHVAGAFAYPALLRGARQTIHRRFDVAAVVDALTTQGVTSTMLVPTMLYMLLDAVAAGARLDGHTLRTLVYVSAPMAPERIERCLELLGPVLVQTYGSSEAPGGVTFLSKRDHAAGGELLASAGRPSLLGDVRVVDEDGAELPAGEVGEVVLRGDYVTPGYWRKPAPEARRDGWWHTNDLGRFDARGYLYLLDRKNDMVITGGFNVYPVEVENVLLAHAAVSEAAVFGVPDPRWGEALAAVVRVTDATAAPELEAWCRERLPAFKVPKSIELADAPLPRNASGKIVRRALREPHWQGRGRSVG